ncbi:hypothetical protein [Glaciecola sp. 1036]|uniref:hypothetical protein n=1 Tax=Alteromonadaceae TaxID=72275 RepID=UPI003D012648
MKITHLHSNFKRSVVCSLVAATFVLAGCNSDNDYVDNNTPDPEPTPPAPVVENFPVQVVAPEVFTQEEIGTIFTSELGLSLYYFANDEQGVSNCNPEEGAPAGGSADPESCAGKWPPLLADETADVQAPFSLIERADQTMQWSYNGFALYTFIDDSSQGDINGDGAGGVFDLARPLPFLTNDEGKILGNETVLTGSNVGGTFETSRSQKGDFTLYTFDGDNLDQSSCFSLGNGNCINAWPPLLADNGARPTGLYDIVEVEADIRQWTLRGKPLYFFINDIEAGDENGHIANPSFVQASKYPASQRDINGVSWLTANGRVNLLTDAGEEIAVDKDQFSLYTFANDTLNTSNCSGACLGNFPAFLATEFDHAVGAFGIIEREDGFMQWTFEGQPLYFAASDQAIDDINGHNVGNVWFLIEPASTNVVAQDSVLGDTVVTQGFTNTLRVDENDEFVTVLGDTSGRQLYTFDNDNAEQSNCTSIGCIGNWPALLAKKDEVVEAPFTTFAREDGSMQMAINGKPLYIFTPDTQAGDQNGEGAGGVWFVARPAPMKLAEIPNQGTGFVAHRLDLQAQGTNDTSKEGFTLYTFNNDVADSGVSNCVGGCATVWPPLFAESSEQAFGEYTVIERFDANNNVVFQWAYQGKPLYFFRDDLAPGDANGLANPSFQIATVN